MVFTCLRVCQIQKIQNQELHMKNLYRNFAFFMAGSFLLSCTAYANTFIVLKLDDLKQEQNVVHSGWENVLRFLNDEGIIGTIGIIGSSLESPSKEYVRWIKNRHNEGHEIWHHGYCHCKFDQNGVLIREYGGASFDSQAASIKKTQKLAKERLGIIMRSFGAPYNSTDNKTANILDEIDDIKVWMFKETKFNTEKFVLDRFKSVNIEYPVHQPNFLEFKKGFQEHKHRPVLVIQGHPRSWVKDPLRFEEFKKIVLFLKEQDVTFTTAYQYYLHAKQLQQ
jgi:peptidoglycan/xylan/chitin deacetylase (PgdA/CDA1 family)